MGGRLRVEAGRVVASGGALLCGRWREERNGGEGAAIGVWGARVEAPDGEAVARSYPVRGGRQRLRRTKSRPTRLFYGRIGC